MSVRPPGDTVLTRNEVAAWLKVKPRQVERLGIPSDAAVRAVTGALKVEAQFEAGSLSIATHTHWSAVRRGIRAEGDS